MNIPGANKKKNKSINKREKISELMVSDPYFFLEESNKFKKKKKKLRVHHFKWFSFPIPNKLSQLTQDCLIMENIEI